MKTFSITFFFLTTLFSGCTNNSINNSDITKADYIISVNEQIQLVIPSNPTTGYSWKWVNKNSVTAVDTFDYHFIPGYPAIPGKGGNEIWNFKGIKSGIDSIKLEYRCPWITKSIVRSKIIVIKVN
jgi:predicted secreted protein